MKFDKSSLTERQQELLRADILEVARDEFPEYADPENVTDLAEGILYDRVGGQRNLASYVACLEAANDK